jgi:hypothetical protein
MNFQVTVLKVLVSYPGGFATMDALKRDMAILATSGPDWSERTKRLAARAPGLNIFEQGLVERGNGGWRVTDKGRAVLELMEARISSQPLAAVSVVEKASAEQVTPEQCSAQTSQFITPPRPPVDRASRRRQAREWRRAARQRVRANAS